MLLWKRVEAAPFFVLVIVTSSDRIVFPSPITVYLPDVGSLYPYYSGWLKSDVTERFFGSFTVSVYEAEEPL